MKLWWRRLLEIVNEEGEWNWQPVETRASGIASHAPRIRLKIAAILACNIVTALSQCRHVRL